MRGFAAPMCDIPIVYQFSNAENRLPGLIAVYGIVYYTDSGDGGKSMAMDRVQ